MSERVMTIQSSNAGTHLNRERRKRVARETGKCSYCSPHGNRYRRRGLSENAEKRHSKASVRDRTLGEPYDEEEVEAWYCMICGKPLGECDA